jgi:hypothetical protein
LHIFKKITKLTYTIKSIGVRDDDDDDDVDDDDDDEYLR